MPFQGSPGETGRLPGFGSRGGRRPKLRLTQAKARGLKQKSANTTAVVNATGEIIRRRSGRGGNFF